MTTSSGIFHQAFHGLEPHAVDTLRTVARMRTYEAGTVLCRQGEIEHTFYIVVEGQVAVVQDLEDGDQRFLAMRGPGEYFGELSLLDDTPRLANCVAVMETRVMEVTQQGFKRMLRESPVVAHDVMRRVVTMLRQNDQAALDELAAKNRELQRAYDELREAQASLVEKERLERELEIAATVQRSLLPSQLPQYDNFSFEAYLRQARAVGGDFYDVIELDDDHVAILLADVVDKSVQAALMMAVSRTLFRTESRRSLSPAEVVTAVHRGVLDISDEAKIFVTAFYGVLERSTGTLQYVMAGHERPLLSGPGRSVAPLAGKGRFLGMIDPFHINEYSTHLKPGDRLLLFSDGVVDSMNAAEQPFGHRRLEAVLEEAKSAATNEVLPMIAAEVDDWCGQAPPFDDLTMLLVQAVPDAD